GPSGVGREDEVGREPPAVGREDEATLPGAAAEPSGAGQISEMRADAPHPTPDDASRPTPHAPRPTTPYAPRPTPHDEHHPAATAAWAERLGDLWLQWLRAQAPAVAADLAAAIRDGAPGGGVPDWWEAVYERIRRRLDE
ncbi:MAG TPA: hypothetical protein VFW96_03040, partial [Thermomicrobiales bacterium]|nr:hypothetical protein [Thermomicrobiales bacterium]